MNNLINLSINLSIWLPILFGVLILFIGKDSKASRVRWLALFGSLLSFIVTLPMYIYFDNQVGGIQHEINVAWIQLGETFKVNYHLGVDGISLWFVLLTAFITVIVVAAGWEVITERVAQYLGAFLILSGLTVGVFLSLDGLLFYVFFEATLIPMYLIIGIWGGPRRVYAAIKFFLYTLAGSLLMLVALVYLYSQTKSFDILVWHKAQLPFNAQQLLFFAFFAAFAVKVPMWPVHTWLPDAHVEAPTGGSVVLAAIMLKLGAYGFLRFTLPILPQASQHLSTFVIALSLVAVIYIGLVALVQTDMKKLVAYSSIAHMGFVTLGFFLIQRTGQASVMGIEGALIQMISHGFVSGAMFLCIGVLYDRLHSREIADYGGVVNTMPKFAAFSLFFAMANCGLPATSGFIGEWYVILAAVQYKFWVGVLSATALIFGAAYSLWMYKRVVFGEVKNKAVLDLQDVNCREFSILGVMALLTLAMGVYPKPVTDTLHASVEQLVKHVQTKPVGK